MIVKLKNFMFMYSKYNLDDKVINSRKRKIGAIEMIVGVILTLVSGYFAIGAGLNDIEKCFSCSKIDAHLKTSIQVAALLISLSALSLFFKGKHDWKKSINAEFKPVTLSTYKKVFNIQLSSHQNKTN